MAILEQWIDNGAEYGRTGRSSRRERPRAARAPRSPLDARNDIDRFVLRRLEREGLDACRRRRTRKR